MLITTPYTHSEGLCQQRAPSGHDSARFSGIAVYVCMCVCDKEREKRRVFVGEMYFSPARYISLQYAALHYSTHTQLPERFELTYTDKHNDKARPVMVHRAVLGSLERMIGLLTEHYEGRWCVRACALDRVQ
jgi:hypothetical protein